MQSMITTLSAIAHSNFGRPLHGQQLFMPAHERGEAVIQLPGMCQLCLIFHFFRKRGNSGIIVTFGPKNPWMLGTGHNLITVVY